MGGQFIVRRPQFTACVKMSKHAASIGMVLFGGLPIPVQSLFAVHRSSVPIPTEPGEGMLCLSIPLSGGFLVPGGGELLVRGDATTKPITGSYLNLGPRIASESLFKPSLKVGRFAHRISTLRELNA